MGAWLGPEDNWEPRHPKPWWRAVLADARSAGWYLRPLSGHSYGVVACSPDAADDRCEYVVFSTAEGSETAAQTFRRMVKACPHLEAADDRRTPQQRKLERAIEHCENAQRLISAAEACHEHEELRGRALELWAEAAAAAEAGQEQADDLLSMAADKEDEASTAKSDGLELLKVDDPPFSEGSDALLSAAHTEARRTDRAVKELRDGDHVRELRNRLAAVKGRINALRAKLPPS